MGRQPARGENPARDSIRALPGRRIVAPQLLDITPQHPPAPEAARVISRENSMSKSPLSLESLLACGIVLAMVAVADAAEKDTRVYEMRVYYAAEGKLDALHARFRDHTMKLFEKHGMTNVGYWVPVENAERKLIY